MKRIGRLDRLADGTYRLQYWKWKNLGYQVEASSTIYKMFENKESAIEFIRKNNIELKKDNQ